MPRNDLVMKSLEYAVAVMEIVESLRQLYPELESLAKVLVSVVKLNVELMRNAEVVNNQPSYGIWSTLMSCVKRALHVLNRLKEKKANYFGVYRQAFYFDEIRNLGYKMKEIVHSMKNITSETHLPQDELPIYADGLISDTSAKIFWTKHFNKDVFQVPWKAFEEAFLKEFGLQIPESISKLRIELVSHDDNKSSIQEICDNIEFVHIYDIDSFSSKHGGLFESYQELVDPGKVIYVMGTIKDEKDKKDEKIIKIPILLEDLLGVNIIQISCGGQHAAALSDIGAVYTWGRGNFGRLGHGDSKSLESPRHVVSLTSQNCVQVACGFAYTAVVTGTGELFTWGAGENGRLGTGDKRDRNVPTKILALSSRGVRVEQVFAGSVHTCVLSHEGLIYSFGKSEYTGHGLTDDVLIPLALDAFSGKHVCQISVGPGGYHTIALTVTGHVYTWGHNRVGQLGYTNSEFVRRNIEGACFLPTPQLVQSLEGKAVCQVVAGWGHSAVVTKSGELFVCGRNLKGQLGLGDPIHFTKNERGHPFQSEFKLVESFLGKPIIQVACGGEHTVVLTAQGEVYTFGAGKKGQLGHSRLKDQCFPQLLSHVKQSRREVHQVACGNNCTLILAGKPTPATLFDLCLERIRNTPELFSFIHDSGLSSDIIELVEQSPVFI